MNWEESSSTTGECQTVDVTVKLTVDTGNGRGYLSLSSQGNGFTQNVGDNVNQKGLLALAKLVAKGRAIQRKTLGNCGSCHFFSWYKMKCSSGGGCGFRQLPLRKTEEPPWPYGEFKLPVLTRYGETLPMDPLHLKGEEKPRPPYVPPFGDFVRTGDEWQQRYPKTIPEERRVHLWNHYMELKKREFERLIAADKKRQAIQYILDALGIEYIGEEVAAVVDEDVELTKQYIESLTTQLTEFEHHGEQVHGGSVEDDEGSRTPRRGEERGRQRGR